MDEVWVKCPKCGKGFDNYPALIAHMKAHIDASITRLNQFQKKLREIKKLVDHALDDALEENCEPVIAHLTQLSDILSQTRRKGK
jgi:uncharacterized C2H2 Zn-finger protein